MLINLASDTSTLPSAGMREAMATAKVGDEQRHEDPTTRDLCVRCADLLGQDDAVFLPTGTMCNVISTAIHCGPGDEIIGARNAHIFGFEGAGHAWLAGTTSAPIDTPTGIFSAAQMADRIRRANIRSPRCAMVVIEQTTNRGGGAIWPIETIRDVAEQASNSAIAVHMDGARLLNAVMATDIPAGDYGALCDSVWLDFTKGLACPFGAVLAGSRDFIKRAWKWKHWLGGAMRQSGMNAAACIYALDHHVDRLAQDHEHAQLLAAGLRAVPGLKVQETVETNIVMIDLDAETTATALTAALAKRDIRLSVVDDHRLRAVTHLNITRNAVKTAIRGITEAMAGVTREQTS